MKNIKLLDCTLRDGGSLNNWCFGKNIISDIYQTLCNANIDIIEAGFIDNNIKNNPDSCLCGSNSFFNTLLKTSDYTKSKVVAMVDLSKYNRENFNFTESDLLSGIRLMFKKEQKNSAFEMCEELSNLGYEISLNPVSVTTYTNKELNDLIKTSNVIKPYALYIVDTYGLMDKNETLEKYKIFNKNLNDNIVLGYHCHNNRQLAFSNSVEIINQKDERNIIIDSSLYGMGKRAGNVPIELIAHFLNENYQKNYNTDILANIILTTILPLHNKFEWGYSVIHYIAAINKCHSDYVSYLCKEKNLNVFETTKILKKLDESEKLTFNKKYIDSFLD